MLGVKPAIEYYYYKLSEKMKNLLRKETILFNSDYFHEQSAAFYAFEDPEFYSGQESIGKVITHEPMISIHLTEKEKNELEGRGKGLLFDD